MVLTWITRILTRSVIRARYLKTPLNLADVHQARMLWTRCIVKCARETVRRPFRRSIRFPQSRLCIFRLLGDLLLTWQLLPTSLSLSLSLSRSVYVDRVVNVI